MLHHAILASVTETIVPLITPATIAAEEAWSRLEKTYASKSHTRIMGLCEILANTSTENRSIADYMQIVKSISETLTLAGLPLSDAELIHSTLQGLGPEFRHLAAAIRARDTHLL